MQKPRTIEDVKPPTNIALPHEGLSYRFPFDTEKKTYAYFDPIAQKPFDANYDGEDDVNGSPPTGSPRTSAMTPTASWSSRSSTPRSTTRTRTAR